MESKNLSGESRSDGEETRRGYYCCWRKMLGLDVREAKKQVLISVPMVLSNVSYFSITMLSVMFAGRLGELQLAGATLAMSWAAATGFAFMTGLSGAVESLCGQAFGAKMHKLLGLYLQASCLISCLFCTIISVLWIYTEKLLVFLRQDPHIAAAAAAYMRHLIPGVFAYGLLQNMVRFLQTQSAVAPLVILSGVPMATHFGVAYALVHSAGLGLKGAAMAASVSLWFSFLLLAAYVFLAKHLRLTWQGFSLESFRYVRPELKLALPSAAMVWSALLYGPFLSCLEYWAFEILIFLAGLMPNPKITTSMIALCVNTQSIAYMITYGLGAAASTRVSNEIGAGNPGGAKNAMVVAMKLSLVLALAFVLSLAFGHNIWATFFSNSPLIIHQFASVTPVLAISIAIDSMQGVLSGIARGCAWQHLAVYINLGTFYLFGIPVAALLGFELKLYAKGLWIGLICGLTCQAATLLLLTLRTRVTKIDFPLELVGEDPLPV